MAHWNALGLRVGYPLPASPQNSDIDAETDVPDSALEAILLNLAIHLAPSYGKVISQDTRTNAKAAFVVALNRAAMPDEQRIGAGLPMGAGNKRLGTFTTETTDEIIEAPEDALSFS